jgi:hypothetical protein
MRRLVPVTAAIVCLVVAMAMPGCGHQLAWPPTAADVARINKEAHDEDGYMRIEYVDPIASDWDAHNVRAVAIDSIKDDYIGFRTREAEISLVPSARVRGITVKDRDVGGLIGAGLGAAAGAAIVAGFWLVSLVGVGPPARGGTEPSRTSETCSLGCAATFIGVTVGITTFVGLVVGYAVSGRKTYEFGAHR